MPTVFRGRGFQIRVLLPPREHGPPHVHVHKADGVVIIDLPVNGLPPRVRKVSRMRDVDVLAAVRLVEQMESGLQRHWERYHGSTTDRR
jgi:hypothetical protein